MRTRIKICGITRPEDAMWAAGVGADAIGLVFYPGSPRFLSIPKAEEIIRALPAFVTIVGLFVNPSTPEVEEVLSQLSIDMLQFHGEETPDACELYGKPYIKALRMRTNVNVHEFFHMYTNARGIVLDTYVKEQHGGTGKAFDWALIPKELDKPVILAGGLNAENIKDAIKEVRPYAVDVSSSLESEKGIKDLSKMMDFVRGVYEADNDLRSGKRSSKSK